MKKELKKQTIYFQVVLNCSLSNVLKYDQTSPTFIQWTDNTQKSYGLDFSSKNDAGIFTAIIDRLWPSQKIATATAKVNVWNVSTKKYVPAGGIPGFLKVEI